MRPEGRHATLVDVAFCDGHVKSLPFEQVYPVKEEVCKAGNGRACSTLTRKASEFPKLWELWK